MSDKTDAALGYFAQRFNLNLGTLGYSRATDDDARHLATLRFTIENQERELALLWAEHEAVGEGDDGVCSCCIYQLDVRGLTTEPCRSCKLLAAHDAVEAMKEGTTTCNQTEGS